MVVVSACRIQDGVVNNMLARSRSRFLLAVSLSRYARLGLAALCFFAIGLLWWLLAGAPSADKILGVYSTRKFVALVAVSYAFLWGVYFALSREASRGKVINATVSTVSLVMVIGILELPALLGILDYRLIISPPQSAVFTKIKPWEDPRNRLDRELVHICRPNQKIVGETIGDLVPWLRITTDRHYQIDAQYDSNGFRNDHEITEAPIITLGDSFLEAALVPQNALLTTQMSQLLQAEVANLGQSGYGPQQELIVLRRYGLPLQPKVVVWLFFEGNDLLDVPRYERLMRDWDAYLRETHGFRERSFTGNVLSALTYLTAPKPATGAADGDEARRRSCHLMGGRSEEGKTIYFAYTGTPLSPEDLTSLATAQQVFLDAQRLAADNGAHLLLAFTPTKFRVYHGFCEFPADGYGRVWQPNDLPERLAAWAKAQGIAYLDLTPPLKEAAAQGELVYFPDDGHWNAAGHEVVARAIAGFIQSNGWR